MTNHHGQIMVYLRPERYFYAQPVPHITHQHLLMYSCPNSRVCFVSFWCFLLIKTLMKTNHPYQSVLYAYQSLGNDQKNWFSVKFLTDVSLESLVKEVQQSTLFFVQTNKNSTFDLPYSWCRCGCWSFYHFWSHSVRCSLSSHSWKSLHFIVCFPSYPLTLIISAFTCCEWMNEKKNKWHWEFFLVKQLRDPKTQ